VKRELIVTAEGRDRTVIVDGPGPDGRFRISIDGVEHGVDAVALRPGSWSLIIAGRSYQVDLDRRRGGIAASVGAGLAWSDAVPFLSGLVYNVPPIRAKDVPFLDVVVASFNNPIRLAMGWFAVPGSHALPPVSLAITFWAIGALLMTAKRFAEIRDLRSADLLRYRRSFQGYTDESLHNAMVVHACLFAFSFGVVTEKYAPELMLLIPFVLIFIGWYFHLSYQPRSVVKEPERLIGNVPFVSYCLAVFVLLLVLLFGPPDVRETSRWLAARF